MLVRSFPCRFNDDHQAPFDYHHNELKVGDVIEYDPVLLGDFYGSKQTATIISIDKKNDVEDYNWRVMVSGSNIDNVEIRYYRWVKVKEGA